MALGEAVNNRFALDEALSESRLRCVVKLPRRRGVGLGEGVLKSQVSASRDKVIPRITRSVVAVMCRENV